MKELEIAFQRQSEYKRFFRNLSKSERKKLDGFAHEAHDAAFREIDCLSCANCCRTTGPLFTITDIDRIAKLFNYSRTEFIDLYLRLDEDGDYVLKETPCAFLLDDNTCLIYDKRPKACREFPHTDRKNFYQIRNLTMKNTLICPITARVVEDVIKKMKV